MFKSIRLFTFFICISVITGCSSISSFVAVQRDESNSIAVVDYSFDKTWESLVQLIASEGETMTLDNKKKGVILTGYDELTIPELKRIGKIPPDRISGSYGENWLYARKKVDYSLRKIAKNQTEVKAIHYLQAYNASGKRWITIVPNGTREQEILGKLSELLENS
jgi:hypothetical protein